MSLLIKALDKAQEEARAVKGKQKAKQSDVGQAPQAAIAVDIENKYQPSNLNSAANGLNLSFSNTASEKIAAASALELELSPNIKTDSADKPTIQIRNRPENNDNINLKQAVDTPKQAGAGLPSAVSASKAFASSKSTDAAVNDSVTKTNAANVFAAKRIEANHQNSKIAFIVGVGVIVLSAIAAYFYQLADHESDLKFAAQRPFVPAPSANSANKLPTTVTAEVNNKASTEIVSESVVTQNLAEVTNTENQKMLKAESSINALRLAQNEKTFDVAETESKPVKAFKEPIQTESNMVYVEQIASKSASIQVSKTTEQAGVNPILMRAYDAYNAGNDTDAIKLYKQVLQRDVRNMDALLGLGAIAQRQGRLQDANGWYGKVLELEPKNSIALGFNLAATLESQPPNDVNNESRIKNMLAKQPDDANLHATLGNFYADSNQWSAAQQAYFEAYRLNASADNAFNLAISLDQLGKPKLALPYYQRALQLSQTARSNIDKAALEARISAIQ